MAHRRAAVMLTTKTGLAFKKRYFAEQWETTSRAAGITDLRFNNLRGTTVTMLAEAGCTLPEIVSITGHTLRRAQEILDKYLAREPHRAALEMGSGFAAPAAGSSFISSQTDARVRTR